MSSGMRKWAAFGIAVLTCNLGFLIASFYFDGLVAIAMTVLLFIPLSIRLARIVTGYDIPKAIGF